MADILREWPLPVRPPDLLRQIPVIADQKPGVVQRVDEPSVTQGRRCLILPGSVTARAARHAYDRQSPHSLIMDQPGSLLRQHATRDRDQAVAMALGGLVEQIRAATAAMTDEGTSDA